MVVLRFFKNGQLLGAKEFPSDNKAEEVGKKWLINAARLFPDAYYSFEMLVPIYLLHDKKTLDGRENFDRFTDIADAVCYKNLKPRMEVVFRKYKFDGEMYG